MTDPRRYNTVVCTQLAQGDETFGFNDQLGRAVGFKWTLRSMVYSNDPSKESSVNWLLYDNMPEAHFEIWSQPTRDGKGYGPAFNTAKFADRQAAEKAIAKRIDQARKRDTKKFVVKG